MRIRNQHYRTIWLADDHWRVHIIDQTVLPHTFHIKTLETLTNAATAIRDMWVRGAPLIGVTAAYGLALALRNDPSDDGLTHAIKTLQETRPTAVNLAWALARMRQTLVFVPPAQRVDVAYREASAMANEDAAMNKAIGEHGLGLLSRHASQKPIHILTHCNAGWLATVDYGTALSPIYQAYDAGIPIHVWVDETRPRNQGASLTAWELAQHGVSHTVIADNAGGHLMQHGQVDMVIVGTDRTTVTGDVCNKIGTYLKALAAKDNDIPFYVALPGPTIDWTLTNGLTEIPIEARADTEVTHITGKTHTGELVRVQLTPDHSPVANPAFDVTPARLVTGFITERGICPATPNGLQLLYERP